VRVHLTADRRLATEHWLLSTLPEPSHGRARTEWQEQGVAMLPLGTLFSAVRIPGRLIYAAAGSADWRAVDEFLDQVLDGGPVICDVHHGSRYYVLVPASMPVTWRQAADDWRAHDVELLGRDFLLGVPPLTAVELDPGASISYWPAPMSAPAMLCTPLTVARLIAAGSHRLAKERGEA
jgi:hypothetical protein